MAWDKALPSGGNAAKLLDDAVRTNNDALETALTAEHSFSTGGSQSGRHKFGVGTSTSRDALTGVVDGSIWFNTTVRPGFTTIQVRQSGSWVDVDVFQSSIPRLNAQSLYTVSQFAQWVSVTPGSGSPNTLAVNLAASPLKYATLNSSTILSNPTGEVSSYGTSCMFDLTISGGSVSAFTFDTKYRFANGLDAIVTLTAGAKTRLFISSMQDGNYLVSSAPNIGT